MDWAAMFIPDTPVWEMIFRGTILYLVLFGLLRFVFRREVGSLGITDLLVLVLIADAAQNAMAGQYTSITDGLVLCATIIFWSYFLEFIGYRWKRMGRLLHPPPLPIVRDGRMIPKHMARELITKEELTSQLREQGVEDLNEVKVAFLEGDGQLSVIKKKGDETAKKRKNPGSPSQ